MIDTHEQLRLLDAWLRQSFVPALPENARFLLAGRDTPSAWQRDLGDLLRTIRLENLSDEAARPCCAVRVWTPPSRSASPGSHAGTHSRSSWPPARSPSAPSCRRRTRC